MAYLRFVTPGKDPDSGVDRGVFQAAYDLLEQDELAEPHLGMLREELEWFKAHLKEPTRFNRTTSKGHYRRKTAGVAWFRDTATEFLKRMHVVKAVLEAHGRPVTIIREQRIGYVVYEDEAQVIAEPFANTKTRAQ
jgi:hypothetical protein